MKWDRNIKTDLRKSAVKTEYGATGSGLGEMAVCTIRCGKSSASDFG
jgi:hypothetical protein